MLPLVSVIIPVYNTAAYLKRCLESVCNQTLKNIEIICINDGSTDNSLEILEEFAKKDSRIHVISTDNNGLGAARNVGLETSKGIWVTGLDSDDYLELDACAYVMSHAAEDVDIIQYGFKVKHNELNESLSMCVMKGKHVVTPHVLVSHSCEFCGKFWRKSFLDKYSCKFPVGVWYEDWFFYWAYLPFAKNVLYLPECKYVIVRRDSSIMGISRNKSERVLDHVRVFGKLMDFRVKYPLPEPFNGLNIINFVQCTRFVEAYLPEKFLPQAIEMYREYAQHPLMKSWRRWTNDNSKSSFLRLFLKIKPGEVNIGIGGIYPLKVHVELDWIVWRLFGFRFLRYKIKHCSSN